MNHYCTYFDRGFLIQGLALWHSLRRHDPAAVLWVLALDEETAAVLTRGGDDRLRPVPLAALEADDRGLQAVKVKRSRAEYYFTLSPCWPRWLLQTQPDLPAVTYLDADLFFFSDPRGLFAEMAASGASVAITAHRFPPALQAYEKWGLYNVGIQIFRNDDRSRAILADWRERCLEWCHDRLEGDRFADQKYLDAWPGRFGAAVQVITHAGVNLAPWNWMQYSITNRNGEIAVGEVPLIVFHFARFRPLSGGIWDSGQLEFGVMPRTLRKKIYGEYWLALEQVRTGSLLAGQYDYRRGTLRRERSGWKGWLLLLAFGPLWWRGWGNWLALGCGPMGRYSGEWLNRWRKDRPAS